jgi:hypothetical protein
LERVEEQSAAALVAALKAKGIDAAVVQPDLSGRVPMEPESDRQWAARRALVEYAYLSKPHFQGTGNMLVRADSSAERPAMAELIGKMLSDQLNSATSDRSERAVPDALRAVAAEGLIGARITRVEQGERLVKVNSQFFARMPDDSWQAVWQHAQQADATIARPQLEARVAQDPQLGPAINVLKGLGLSGAQDLGGVALRRGAATMEALDGPKGVNTSFEQLVIRHTRRLDSLPLTVADGAGMRPDAP